LVQDAGKRQEMGRNARKLVEQDYTWDRVTEQTENAYKEYLGARIPEAS
jgi:glycosyltransferase involved in cell wall biosynthesis